jgi:transcription-repair coupling factor (superfamily II helicase)
MQDLQARVERGGSCPVWDVCEASHPFLAALARRMFPGRVTVLVVDGLKVQEGALQDLQTWLGAAGVDGGPLFYPDWEVLPHESKLPHVDVISDRMSTLLTLRGAEPGAGALVVTTVAALMQRTFSPSDLAARLRPLRVGDSWDPLDLVEWLEEQGYEPEAQVTQKGTLSLRGGIVDVWPPSAPWPVRLEFFGNDLDSLREFDPLTQLSKEKLERIVLTPAGELGLLKKGVAEGVGAGAFGSLLDFVPRGSVLVLSEPERLEERAAVYSGRIPDGDPFLISWEGLRKEALGRGDAVVELRSAEDIPGVGSGVELREDAGGVAGGGADVEMGEGAKGRGEALGFGLRSLEAFRPLGARAPEPAVAEAQRREFFEQIHRWLRRGFAVHVYCNNEGERQRFGELWQEFGLAGGVEAGGGVSMPRVEIGALGRGFIAEEPGLVVVTDAEIFGRYKVLRPRRLKSPHAQTSRSLLDIDFTELEEGDFVVHIEHGIGRFLGLQVAPASPGHRGAETGPGQECLAIEYAASRSGDPAPRLYVPISEAHLVGKYVGAGKARPQLNTLGGGRWDKTKKEAERAVADLAAELLEIQAARETQPGHAFPADTAWQREFEASFLFEETPDQVRAIDASKRDMELPRPMDRLICGDVGFGKTEVAIRAAFKAVMGGRQVAILVPTTVLAQQHYNTFSERMRDYPVRVELLSRFRTRREQTRVIERLADGGVDIVIGTHRLVQKDVQFKDLGLVVIDEEQRFGVMHKERFKLLRRTVDVLTLSATPIPRTLYLALSGARDMSTIETPPQDRLPVETFVSAYDERLVRDAIRRELDRQGQVFFLHNRVTTIDVMATKIRALVPEARLAIGHGQMDPDELEEVMTRFVNGEVDVLLSTTIVESGLDIPNANTIIIDRADRFGLSELYQLRGRVGRYKHQAYAYLLIPRHAQLLSEARKRIAAIRQYSSLGSGFKIAMRDLEIRGAGNLLGPQQSGHITAVGFDLYCQLLKQSVSSLKGEKIKPRVEVDVRFDFMALHPAEEQGGPARSGGRVSAGLPSGYVPDAKQRIELHRRFAQVSEPGELKRLKEDLRDRYGPPPQAVELLMLIAELKLIASALDVSAIDVREDQLRLTRRGDFVQVGGRFPRLTKKEPKARLAEIRRFLSSLGSSLPGAKPVFTRTGQKPRDSEDRTGSPFSGR